MNLQRIFPAFIILAILFLMSSCTQDEFIEDLDANNKSSFSTKNHFQILPLNDSKVIGTNYTANYRVELESSEFDIKNDMLQLEIPIPVGDFSFLRAYNVSTDSNVAILYVIQREKQNVVVNLPVRFVAQDQLTLSELNIDTKLLAKNGCMRVYVMNNSEKDLNNDEDKITNCFMDSLDNYSCKDTYAFPLECSNNDSNDNKRPQIVGGGIIK